VCLACGLSLPQLSRALVADLVGRNSRRKGRCIRLFNRRPSRCYECLERATRALPTALSAEVVDLIVRVRKELTDAGPDAGPRDHCLAPAAPPHSPGRARQRGRKARGVQATSRISARAARSKSCAKRATRA
jgi:hypothetical protein